jgi:hypothetical protein
MCKGSKDPCPRYLEEFILEFAMLMIITPRLLLVLLISNHNKMMMLCTLRGRDMPHVHII